MPRKSLITTVEWGVDARCASPAWVAVRAHDAPRLAQPLAMRDIVLDLRQMVTQTAGMMVGGAAGILLASTLEMGGVAVLLFFVLSILCGGWLGLLAGRGLTAALNRRWRTRYGREREDMPLVILSPYRPNSSPHDLVERLDQSAGLLNAGGGEVTREDFEHARLLVMRALHAEQIEHRADAAYIAAESFLNTLTLSRSA